MPFAGITLPWETSTDIAPTQGGIDQFAVDQSAIDATEEERLRKEEERRRKIAEAQAKLAAAKTLEEAQSILGGYTDIADALTLPDLPTQATLEAQAQPKLEIPPATIPLTGETAFQPEWAKQQQILSEQQKQTDVEQQVKDLWLQNATNNEKSYARLAGLNVYPITPDMITNNPLELQLGGLRVQATSEQEMADLLRFITDNRGYLPTGGTPLGGMGIESVEQYKLSIANEKALDTPERQTLQYWNLIGDKANTYANNEVQLAKILDTVNTQREDAGLDPINASALQGIGAIYAERVKNQAGRLPISPEEIQANIDNAYRAYVTDINHKLPEGWNLNPDKREEFTLPNGWTIYHGDINTPAYYKDEMGHNYTAQEVIADPDLMRRFSEAITPQMVDQFRREINNQPDVVEHLIMRAGVFPEIHTLLKKAYPELTENGTIDEYLQVIRRQQTPIQGIGQTVGQIGGTVPPQPMTIQQTVYATIQKNEDPFKGFKDILGGLGAYTDAWRDIWRNLISEQTGETHAKIEKMGLDIPLRMTAEEQGYVQPGQKVPIGTIGLLDVLNLITPEQAVLMGFGGTAKTATKGISEATPYILKMIERDISDDVIKASLKDAIYEGGKLSPVEIDSSLKMAKLLFEKNPEEAGKWADAIITGGKGTPEVKQAVEKLVRPVETPLMPPVEAQVVKGIDAEILKTFNTTRNQIADDTKFYREFVIPEADKNTRSADLAQEIMKDVEINNVPISKALDNALIPDRVISGGERLIQEYQDGLTELRKIATFNKIPEIVDVFLTKSYGKTLVEKNEILSNALLSWRDKGGAAINALTGKPIPRGTPRLSEAQAARKAGEAVIVKRIPMTEFEANGFERTPFAERIKAEFPKQINFDTGNIWSRMERASGKDITVGLKGLTENEAKLATLHEVGHLQEGTTNVARMKANERLGIEMDAWDWVMKHADEYGVDVSDIPNIFKRSTNPKDKLVLDTFLKDYPDLARIVKPTATAVEGTARPISAKMAEIDTKITEKVANFKDNWGKTIESHNKTLSAGVGPTKEDLAMLKDLTELAGLYIQKGGYTVEAFAKEVGMKVSDLVQKAWDEAGKIALKTPEEKQDYTLFVTKPEQKSIVDKVSTLLEQIKPSIEQNKQILHEARQNKLAASEAARALLSGEDAADAALAALRGKVGKIGFEPLENSLSKEEQTILFDIVNKTPDLRGYTKDNVVIALKKIIHTGEALQPNEMMLMEYVFGKPMADKLLVSEAAKLNLANEALQILNLPKATLASGDFSAAYRQGQVFFWGYPKETAGAFVDGFKAVGGKKYTEQMIDRIKQSEFLEQITEAKVYFGLIGKKGGKLGELEEAYLSKWVDKIPFLKQSQDAYLAFLDHQRLGVAENILRGAEKVGYDINNAEFLKSLGNLINWGTGRGTFGKTFNLANPTMNLMVFSPRYLASRPEILTFPFTQKVAGVTIAEKLTNWFHSPLTKAWFRGMGSVTAVNLTILGMLKEFGIIDVETNSNSADFGKGRIGNVTFDIWGGYVQWARLFSQLITGEGYDALSQAAYPINRLDALTNFMRNKSAPLLGFIFDRLQGRDQMGVVEFDNPAVQEAWNRLIPLAIQDTVDGAHEAGLLGGLLTGITSMFGVGVQVGDEGQRIQSAFTHKKAEFSMIVKQVNDFLAAGDKVSAQKVADANVEAGLYLSGTGTKKEYKSRTTEKMNINNSKVTKLKDQIDKIEKSTTLNDSEKRDQIEPLRNQIMEYQKDALRKVGAL